MISPSRKRTAAGQRGCCWTFDRCRVRCPQRSAFASLTGDPLRTADATNIRRAPSEPQPIQHAPSSRLRTPFLEAHASSSDSTRGRHIGFRYWPERSLLAPGVWRGRSFRTQEKTCIDRDVGSPKCCPRQESYSGETSSRGKARRKATER